MDEQAAKSLLKEVLCLLPTGWWWLLHQQGVDDLGIAKVFGHPGAEISALLFNAGIGSYSTKGFTIVKRKWEMFCITDVLGKDELQFGLKGRVYYVANENDPALFRCRNEGRAGGVISEVPGSHPSL